MQHNTDMNVNAQREEDIFPIPWARPYFFGKEEEYVVDALRSTWISRGPYLDQFEIQFAEFYNIPFALTASNGTVALHMAYLALGLNPGDEIIVPGYSFMAPANVAMQMNLNPVFTEVDPHSWCVTAEEIEKAITPKTRAIVPVHTYGNVCEMDEIMALAESRNIYVVEDAAESLLSRYKDQLSGSIGTIGTFSFDATKTITTGEGGMVITSDKEIYERLWLFRNHGMKEKKYWHTIPGYNFRLTNIQAAFGCAQFENIGLVEKKRKHIHKLYSESLSKIDGIQLQYFPKCVDPVLYAMAIKIDPQAFPQGRDKVMDQLDEMQIETRRGFYAPSLLDLYNTSPLPVCENICLNLISLPTFLSISDEQIDYIAKSIMKLKK